MAGQSTNHSSGTESPQQAFTVTCVEFRAFDKNTLKGFATLHVAPPGLSIDGCTAHTKGDKRWISLPSRQYADADGVVCWSPFLSFSEKAAYWRFQELACSALDEFLERAGINLLEPATAGGVQTDGFPV